jgi:CrcB protein
LKSRVGYGISLGAIQNRNRQRDADNAYQKRQVTQLKWIEFALLAAGAVIGAVLRYKLVESPWSIYGLPLNVLVVNIIGSFILGFFAVMSPAFNLDPKYTLFMGVGFCGSLTTMSSFALETSNLFDNSRYGLMALNILTNVGLSLGAVFAGKTVADLVMERILN